MNARMTSLIIAPLCAIVMVAQASAQSSLQFNGSTQYVTFGAATATLGTPTFTLEVWFKRTGAGVTTSTGTGGVTAVPLLTKGRGEADATNQDANYFLGIRSTDNVLVADYEEAAGQLSPGLNHPVAGTTAIQNDVWYHAAATFDGVSFRLYLNGRLDGTTVVGAGRLPRFDSQQHAALASAQTTTGAAAGFFAGQLDEARIWNHARPEAGIRDSALLEIAGAPGLLGRWSLDDGAGATATNSIAGSPNGTLIATPTWVSPGSPFAYAYGLRFNGSTAYATMGAAPAAGLGQFTIETWFRRDAAGTPASTGAGGIAAAIPLVSKGAGEADGSNVDMNYFLGINNATGVIAADFEEGALGATPGLNHPVLGVTPIANGQWYHAAATYDGATWNLYLNGNLETSLAVNQPPQSASIQHLGLGTTLNSTGVAAGFFAGALDETRIWNYARTQSEIQADVNAALPAPAAGLVARWGMNEGAGSTVPDSSGSVLNGTLVPASPTSAWGWVAGAPFDIVIGPPTPPADPSGLVATAPDARQVHLAWTDNSSNETGFEVERSTTGPGGPFTLRATVAAGVATFDDFGLDPETEYCYQVRAVNAAGGSNYTSVECVTTPAEQCLALDFAGTDAHVTFGNAPAVSLGQFTLEMWIRRDGPGTGTNTGTGGIPDLIPLLSKGRAEAESATADINYIFGIRASDGLLAADFEEGPGGGSPSLNHPVAGVTPITVGAWHHVAATYDGGTWRLYLDGELEGSLVVNQPPASSSIVALSLARALNSTNVAAGAFDGAVDELRIWSHARSQTEIQDAINQQIEVATPGLVGRWALNESSGTIVNPSAGTSLPGTLVGAGWSRIPCAPFNALVTHDIVASAGPNGAIAPVGTVAVPHRGSQMFTITPDAGYHVADVVVDAGSVGVVLDYTFTDVIADHTIDATFAINTYALDVAVVGSGTVAKVPDQATYDHGTTVELTAAPAVGWTFAGWSGDASGAANPYSLLMDGNKAVTATFAINTYALDVAVVGSGTVAKAPDQAAYDHGTTVELTAAPAVGWTFAGWSGDASGAANPYSLLMDGNKSVTATFTINAYTLDVAVVGSGTVAKAPDQAAYDHGTTVELTAAPAVGWTFAGWSGDASGAANPYSLLMDGNKAVTATFTINAYTLDVAVVGSGTVAKAPDQAAYDHGTTVELTAAPAVGWTFAGWSGDASGAANPYSLLMDGNKSVTATFTINAYTLNLTVIGCGTVVKAPNHPTYEHGTPVELTVIPCSGWMFSGWSGDVSGSANPIQLVMNGNKSVTATLAINTYTLDVTVVGSGTVAKVPDQATYDHGTTVELTAIADEGWTFLEWGGDASGTNNPLTVVMNGNLSITATFDIVTAVLVARFDAEPVNGGIEIRWELNGAEAMSTQLERALDRQGPWTAANVDTRMAGALTVARDRSVEPGREYWYRLAVTIPGAGTVRFGPIHAAGIAAVQEFELASIAPNPSFGPATVRFAIAQEARVNISVVDVQGRLVATLIDGPMAPGRYQAAWDGRSANGPASAGVYFVRMSAGRFTKVQRFALAR